MEKLNQPLRFMAVILMGCSLLLPSALAATPENPVTEETALGRKMAQQATKWEGLWITADHTKHKALQQDFKSGPEVTKACLSCHTEAASQFHKTIHWTWLDPATADSKLLGKGGLSINNF